MRPGTGHEQPLVVGSSEAAGGDVLGPWNLYGHHSFLGAWVPAGHPPASEACHPQSPVFVGAHAVWHHQIVILGIVYHHAPVSDGARGLVVGVTKDTSGVCVHMIQDIICGAPPKAVGENRVVEPFQNIYKLSGNC